MGRYHAWACPARKEYIDADEIGGHVKIGGQEPAMWAVLAYATEGPWVGLDIRVIFDEHRGPPWQIPGWDEVYDGTWTDASKQAHELAGKLGLPPPR